MNIFLLFNNLFSEFNMSMIVPSHLMTGKYQAEEYVYKDFRMPACHIMQLVSSLEIKCAILEALISILYLQEECDKKAECKSVTAAECRMFSGESC